MGLYKEIVTRLRSRIREFEDRKITGADLGREVFAAAREIPGEEEGSLRRAIEWNGNRIQGLAERSLSEPVRGEILEVIDDLEGELTERGY